VSDERVGYRAKSAAAEASVDARVDELRAARRARDAATRRDTALGELAEWREAVERRLGEIERRMADVATLQRQIVLAVGLAIVVNIVLRLMKL
jgi:hypothetical protein